MSESPAPYNAAYEEDADTAAARAMLVRMGIPGAEDFPAPALRELATTIEGARRGRQVLCALLQRYGAVRLSFGDMERAAGATLAVSQDWTHALVFSATNPARHG